MKNKNMEKPKIKFNTFVFIHSRNSRQFYVFPIAEDSNIKEILDFHSQMQNVRLRFWNDVHRISVKMRWNVLKPAHF